MVFGPVADRVKSKKRILIVSGTIAAIAYGLLPFGFMMITPETSGNIDLLQGPFVFTVVVLCVMIGAFMTSQITESALFQVVMPSVSRAKASAYRVFIGGLTFVLTMLVGNQLYKMHVGMPFWISAGFFLLTLVLYGIFIKEPQGDHFETKDAAGKHISIFRQVKETVALFTPAEKKAFAIISFTKFMLIFGVMAFQTYGSSYIVNTLGINEAEAGNYTIIFFAGYMLSALPAGYLSNKIGRKNMVLIALAFYAVVGIFQYFTGMLVTLIPALFLIGASTGVSDVIPMCMAADTAPDNKVMGTTMGVYFFIATMSPIIAVPLFGWIFEVTNNNWSLMWLGVAITGILGFLLMSMKKDKIGEMKKVEAV